MRRRTFAILSAASLCFCAAVVVLAIRSYWLTDSLTRRTAHSMVVARAYRGELALAHYRSAAPYFAANVGWHYERLAFMTDYVVQPTRGWRAIVAAFEGAPDPTPRIISVAFFAFPLWFIAAAFAILPAWQFIRWRRHRGTRHRGYDIVTSTSAEPPA